MCIFISLGAANEVCGPGLTTRGGEYQFINRNLPRNRYV